MRYCFALDLVDTPASIAEYEQHHQRIWPEIEESIRLQGITVMEIYRVSNRLFMIMETDETFSFDQKAAADAANPVVQKWEKLMSSYQQTLPFAEPNEKWVLMKPIFNL